MILEAKIIFYLAVRLTMQVAMNRDSGLLTLEIKGMNFTFIVKNWVLLNAISVPILNHMVYLKFYSCTSLFWTQHTDYNICLL